MLSKKYCVDLTLEEHRMVIQALVDYKNNLNAEDLDMDDIDDVIIKVCSAPAKLRFCTEKEINKSTY